MSFVRFDPPLEAIAYLGDTPHHGIALIGVDDEAQFLAVDRFGGVEWVIAKEILIVDPRVQTVAESAWKRWNGEPAEAVAA